MRNSRNKLELSVKNLPSPFPLNHRSAGVYVCAIDRPAIREGDHQHHICERITTGRCNKNVVIESRDREIDYHNKETRLACRGDGF